VLNSEIKRMKAIGNYGTTAFYGWFLFAGIFFLCTLIDPDFIATNKVMFYYRWTIIVWLIVEFPLFYLLAKREIWYNSMSEEGYNTRVPQD